MIIYNNKLSYHNIIYYNKNQKYYIFIIIINKYMQHIYHFDLNYNYSIHTYAYKHVF